MGAPDFLCVDTTTVQKLRIYPGPRQRPVNVFLEDYGPGRGKLTVESDGDAWSHFWACMGDEYDMRSFFLSAHPDYLVRKLKIGICSHVDDEDAQALISHTQAVIIRRRLYGELTRERARELFNESLRLTEDGIAAQSDQLEDLLGCAWYENLPKKPNPEYDHLRRVVETVQWALRQLGE